MFFKRTIKRFAHITGYTFVTYSDNGEIITSGTDGEIRIWKEISDDDPTSQCIGENGNCCVQYTNDNCSRILVSTENVVQAYRFPDFNRDNIEMRFSLPVTSIKVNEKWMVAGSEDFTIKVRKLDKSEDVFELTGHNGPILHLDLNNKNILASSSGDGTIRLWNLDTKENIKTFDGLERVSKFTDAKNYSTPAFEKTGRYLAFPQGRLINIIETTNWEIKFKLENPEISSDYTACSFSNCGSYLSAGTMSGEISVWSLADNSQIKGEYVGEESHGITSIAFNPKDNEEIAFCDSDGQLSTVKLTKSKKITNGIDERDMQTNDENVDPDDIYGGIDFRDDDEDNENCVALEKLKNETMRNNGLDSEDDDDSKSVKSRQSTSVQSVKSLVKPFQLQPSFQPSSTPVHLEHRFMVWNHIGQVLCHSSMEENSIIVEFHNVTLHPSLHIVNTLNHQLASLSETCLALATKETPCKLVCISLLSSGNKEWSTTMPDCEEIMCITAGSSFVAVATDAGYLRIFTTMGTQREIVMLPGQIVCLSAFGNKLVAAYHSSNTCNKYSAMVINIMGLEILNRVIDIPLASNTKLNWLGFSDCGSIIAYESSGRMLSYSIKRNFWIPICDLTNHVNGASDSFFIIGVSERSQKIRATLCRGTSYPLTTPRPIMREIDYSMPLCYMETEKSKLEDLLIRSVNFDVESANKVIVENGLKLFSTALNSELESRAFEIIELIRDRKLIELASRYSSQKGRMHMSNKVLKLLNNFDEKEAEKKNMMNELEKETECFNETYESNDTKNEMKKSCETSTPVIAPRPMIQNRKSNPFKKVSNNTSSNISSTALNHLTKKSIGYSDSLIVSDDENTPSNNISKIQNRSISVDTPRPGNFGQWFIANKDSLKTDNPELSDIELMKIGKSVYKELTQKNKSMEEEATNDTSKILNKRKLDMNDDVTNVSTGGIAKLAKFGYDK
ncbi:hypothetical protein PVAND_009899 [Polypedilum vanderplanki]|uniref:Uncharacterized protein n=1 Tax=Polypedilum vanderplanki TaxID=319348 RepID=A0A9J6CFK5_POLVA|nr:hypothetical protein PVAND_009899 [Polypedilum vanderplanki]